MICIGSVSLKLGSLRHPEPGLFPFIIGCAIILSSTIQLVIELYRVQNTSAAQFWPHLRGLKRVIIIFILLIFYAGALDYLGFLLCTFIFFAALFRAIGQKSWNFTILHGATVSTLTYVLFQILLKINLPKGPYGF